MSGPGGYGASSRTRRTGTVVSSRGGGGGGDSVGGGTAFVEPAFHVRLAFGEAVHFAPVRGHRILEPVPVRGHRILEAIHAPVLSGGGANHESGEGEGTRQSGADDGADDGEGVGVHALSVAREWTPVTAPAPPPARRSDRAEPPFSSPASTAASPARASASDRRMPSILAGGVCAGSGGPSSRSMATKPRLAPHARRGVPRASRDERGLFRADRALPRGRSSPSQGRPCHRRPNVRAGKIPHRADRPPGDSSEPTPGPEPVSRAKTATAPPRRCTRPPHRRPTVLRSTHGRLPSHRDQHHRSHHRDRDRRRARTRHPHHAIYRTAGCGPPRVSIRDGYLPGRNATTRRTAITRRRPVRRTRFRRRLTHAAHRRRRLRGPPSRPTGRFRVPRASGRAGMNGNAARSLRSGATIDPSRNCGPPS